jgi:ABC-type phosphate transport system substrate-binding protein
MIRRLLMSIVFVMSFSVVFAASNKNSIQVKGSDTMVNLGQAWAEKYMEENLGDRKSVV